VRNVTWRRKRSSFSGETSYNVLRPIAMKHIYRLLLILLVSSSALAQTGSLRGQVTDQNGGGVPGAKVTVNGPSGLVKTTNTDKGGSYSFAGLPAGDYEVQASAPNLELAEATKISLKGGSQTLSATTASCNSNS
jgi:hypothetical protein